MKRNQLEVFYETTGQEDVRLQKGGAHYLEFLTACRYFAQHLPANAHILDSCAGTGAYAFHLARQGHCVTAGDIVPHNVKILQKKQKSNPPLQHVQLMDAADLSCFADGQFQAVLCMGALYHQLDHADRERTMKESLRVLQPNGIFVCTYINRHAVILNNCVDNVDNIDELLQFSSHGREGIFYTAPPKEMELLMQKHGLTIHAHVALDGLWHFLLQAKRITQTGLHRLHELHFKTCEEEHLLGYSYHNMLLCTR